MGDAFSQEMKMEWKIIEDEYGRDPALIVRNTSISFSYNYDFQTG